MSTLNFEEFDKSSIEQWQQLLTKELGDRAQNSLTWQVSEDVVMEPYAFSSAESYAIEGLPTWEMMQGIQGSSPAAMNKLALEALMGGCNAVCFSSAPTSAAELELMLKDVYVQYISLHIDGVTNLKGSAQWLKQLCDSRELHSKELRGAFYTDFNSLTDDDFADSVHFLKDHFVLFRGFAVDAVAIHEAGANPIQEIAFALTEGHAFLVRAMDAGLTVDEAAAMIQFNFATGSSYFAEIAKYRAFRWAWKSIIEQYTPEFGCSIHTHIAASTSRYYQTAKDAHNNLLRATTQAMSALIGGVNSVKVEPYNANTTLDDAAALRWSRNIQQLLTEESYFESYRSAANGSHYIEQFTGKVLRAGWSLFQQWDAIRGGAGKAAFDKQWTKDVAEHQFAAQQALASGKRVIVGVNKYVNKSDSSVVAHTAKTFTASHEQA